MMFNKLTLIENIDAGLAADKAAREAWAKVRETKLAEHRDAWLAKQRPRFVKMRDELTAALRGGGTITQKQLPEYFARRAGAFEAEPYEIRRDAEYAGDDYRGKLVNRAEFEALRGALVALVGDEVSDRQLGSMGFGASSISKIFRAAVIS